jgi:hypothetical protein
MRSKGIFVLAGLAFLLLVSSGCGGTPGGGTPTCPTSSLPLAELVLPQPGLQPARLRH